MRGLKFGLRLQWLPYVLCGVALWVPSLAAPQDSGLPPRITTLTARDHPQDSGGAIDLSWAGYTPPPNLHHYNIYRSALPIRNAMGLTPIGVVQQADATTYTDWSAIDGADYYYAVTAADADDIERKSVVAAGPVQSVLNVPPPAPPSDVRIEDNTEPDDPGGVIDVTWSKSPDDAPAAERPVTAYRILRLHKIGGDETPVGEVLAGRTYYKDTTAELGVAYLYGVRALAGEARSELVLGGPVVSDGAWYNTKRTNVLVGLAIYAALVFFFISRARRGHELYVRPIAGLEALDDAIGRATEMGRPILYISGLGGASGISTIAAMLILGRVARRVAEYETPLLVPCIDPIVMNIEREIVRQAYLEAGHADAFDPDSVFFAAESQFAYVGAVDGIMLRERPAANIYMGYFYAESLILAETGASTGAIQIAGTDSDTQLPFFVTTCDYTLMGEELYAASAYLSREPLILGSLKGQDWGKVLITAILIGGAAIVTSAPGWVQKFLELFASG